MSNTEGGVGRSAGRHKFAIWGMVFAVAVVGIVLLLFAPWRNDEDVARNVQPGEAVPTVSGTDAAAPDVAIAPAEAETPASGSAGTPTPD